MPDWRPADDTDSLERTERAERVIILRISSRLVSPG